MKITKIKIENYKSIKDIDFDLKKYGNSYTTMLVGINESGKSNILEAISYFDTPEDEFDYNVIQMWGASIIGFGRRKYTYANGKEGEWMLIGFSPRTQNIALYGLKIFKITVGGLKELSN